MGSLSITTDGFTVMNAMLTFTGSQNNTLSLANNIISVSGVTLSAPDFSVVYGLVNGDGGPSVTGTITAMLSGIQLFPEGGFITMSASATGSYTFSNFDGVSPTGQLSFTITDLTLSIGGAIEVTANNVTITPDQSVIASITGTSLNPAVTISSPDFPALTATIQSLTITQTGFTLGSLSLNTGSSPSALSGLISFSSLNVTLSNFAFNYNGASGPTISGTIGVSAANVVLFPNVSFLDVALGNLNGSYTFDAPGALTFNNINLTIPIGNALSLQFTGVTFTPDQPTVLSFTSATVTSNLIPGLTGSITNFTLTRTPTMTTFALSASLSGTNIKIGNFLSFQSVTLSANSLLVKIPATGSPTISGTVTATLSGMQLFPDDGSISLTLSGSASGSLDLTTGEFNIQLPGFVLSIANDIILTTGTVGSPASITISPGQNPLVTLTSANLDIIPLNLTASISSLIITQTGFTIGGVSLSAGPYTIGGVLSLSDLTLTAHNLAYTYSNTGGSLSGTIGFSGSATLSLSDALSISATVNASYDLGTGVFNAILGAFSFSIGDSLSLSVTSADLNYQPDYATTINTSTLTFTAGGTGTIPVSSVAPFVVGQTITINNQQFTINSINGSNLNVTSSSAATVPSGSVAPGKVATILLGVTGATAFVGYGSVANNNAIGVELANGTLALAVFYTSGATPSTTYAFQAGGSLSLVGFSGIGLTVSGNVLATSNNSTSSVTESIAVDSTPADNIGLSVAANTTTVNTSGVTISIASFVNITGNFGFSTTTTGNVSTLAITADNVNASLSAGNVSVTVGDAGPRLDHRYSEHEHPNADDRDGGFIRSDRRRWN